LCEEPEGKKGRSCPNCARGKVKCQINGVGRGELAKDKKKTKGEVKPSVGSGTELAAILAVLEKVLAENRGFHKAVLAANQRHYSKVERLLTEAADPTYAYVPPGQDTHIDDEWRPITESEIELTNQALNQIEQAGKIPTQWEYRGPSPPADMQRVWEWFYRKGVINRRGRYLGGHEDLMSEYESEEEAREIIDLEDSEDDEEGPRGAGEMSESGGPSGPSHEPTTEPSEKRSDDDGETKEKDSEVQAVEKGVEDMVVG
jgi:hypothetical protein